MQSRKAVQRIVGEQLAFELKRSLFGRKEDKFASGIFFERLTDFTEAAEGFTAAGGTQEKSHLHEGFLAQRDADAKAQRIYFPVGFQQPAPAWFI